MKNKADNWQELAKNLGLAFKDKNLLQMALTHRSFLNECRHQDLSSNERLEFLGDAILAFWVSREVFQRFPDFPEGKLTFLRTHLVRTETLSQLARNLNLGEHLRMSKGEEQGGGRENFLLLANVFEAVVGAIFLDQEIAVTGEFLKRQFEEKIAAITDVTLLKDSKSLLQEIVQAKGHPSPSYQLISATGPDHQKIFTMGVYLEGKLLAEGVAKSKQEAEEEAAKKALEIYSQIK